MSSPHKPQTFFRPPSTMKISFHDLPEDVRQHLAISLLSSAEGTAVDDIYLTDNENLTTVLSYAKVDDNCCPAVMKAMGNKFSPYHWDSTTLNEWISTCHELIYEINLLKSLDIKLQPGLLRRLPNLQKAAIIGIPDQLSSIHRTRKLTELSVRLHSLSIWDQLIMTIRSLPLKTLRLDLGKTYKRVKLEKMPLRELLRLSAACPNVDRLDLIGDSRFTLNLHSMIDAFRSLRKIGLKAKIFRHHLKLLRKFSEVDLYEPVSIESATDVGTSLVGVQLQNKTTSEDIAKLSACPNLRRLSVSLHENAEVDLVGVINNVEELFLKWKYTYTFAEGVKGALALCSDLKYPKYYEPNGAVLASIVNSTRRLKSLTMANAIVKGETVRKLLENAGRYLENIDFNIDWQMEPTVPRLHLILKSISRYCPSLRTVHFLENSSVLGRRYIFATIQQKESCLRAVEEIQLASPRFVSHKAIKSFIEDRLRADRYGTSLHYDDVL